MKFSETNQFADNLLSLFSDRSCLCLEKYSYLFKTDRYSLTKRFPFLSYKIKLKSITVIGWSPVIIMTRIPAEIHFCTEVLTPGLGGSNSDNSPKNLIFLIGKLGCSILSVLIFWNLKLAGYSSRGRRHSQKPNILSPYIHNIYNFYI